MGTNIPHEYLAAGDVCRKLRISRATFYRTLFKRLVADPRTLKLPAGRFRYHPDSLADLQLGSVKVLRAKRSNRAPNGSQDFNKSFPGQLPLL
jgi:predicted DNA-binding transcriptional regulator AlpA